MQFAIFLKQIQDDLRHLREQINDAAEGRSTEKFDLREIEKAIERTEQGVKVLDSIISAIF